VHELTHDTVPGLLPVHDLCFRHGIDDTSIYGRCISDGFWATTRLQVVTIIGLVCERGLSLRMALRTSCAHLEMNN
jgi:hypothetical protein